MIRVATLGPEGTFSDQATRKYIQAEPDKFEIIYFDTIKLALEAIGHECQLGVIPIENLSEGYVSLVLDHLVDSPLRMVGEISLPIQFSCVSNAEDIARIQKIFVQFVAKGQCSEFINSMKGVSVVSTESNISSLEQLKLSTVPSAAIVPHNSHSKESLFVISGNVNDYPHNETRFLVFSQVLDCDMKTHEGNFKTSMVVLNEVDRPGLLAEILSSFSVRNINLCSIVSRPTRQRLGKYHFFIDVDGHSESRGLREALSEISMMSNVFVFGSYLKSGSV